MHLTSLEKEGVFFILVSKKNGYAFLSHLLLQLVNELILSLCIKILLRNIISSNSIAHLIKEFCGSVCEEAVKANSTLIYEILEEIIVSSKSICMRKVILLFHNSG